MGSVKQLTKLIPAVVMVAGLITPQVAQAADILLDPPVYEVPEVAPVSRGGWYLRGDITYDFRNSEGGTYYPAAEMFTDVEMENSWDVGVGVGYQVNDYFRVDATAEYVFGSEWTGNSWDTTNICAGLTATGGGSVTAGTEPGTCESNDSANVSTLKIMANAYWDIANFAGFTPYVGAGIGGAYVMYDDFKQVQNGTLTCCVTTFSDQTIEHEGINSWRFAYALHAGMSYDISSSWKLDVGYSYTDISGGPMAEYINKEKPQAYDDGFTDHVVRAGVRYQIW